MNVDGLILAGGRSTRMNGNHKGNLIYQDQTFMERIISELKKEAQQIWISYGTDIQREYEGCRIVMDEHPGCGPIGGLSAGLRCCRSEIVMVAPCDMPFLKVNLYRMLYNLMEPRYSAVVPVIEGKVHPLAAIYRKKAAEIFEEQISIGNYRLKDALKRMDVRYVDVPEASEFAEMLQNINTAAEYQSLIEERR